MATGRMAGSARRRLVRWLVAALGALAAWPLAAPAHARLPPVRHVFVIVLENENAGSTFGPRSKAPYLARTLTRRGQLLPNYYAIGHLSLDNYIAMVSGQAPNVETQSDCQVFSDFLPGLPALDGQFLGQGCVYPSATRTIADQLDASGLSWKGYLEDMGNDPARDGGRTCAHPPVDRPDPTQHARRGDQYAVRHNPFVYFRSIIDDPRRCAARDVPLDRLPGDLRRASRTPNYAFIAPNLCNDGHDEPCVDGRPGGLRTADAFLRRWVPRILASPAFRRDGLLVVTFDEAESGPGGHADARACCGERPGFNTINPGGPTPGPGGGRIGAVVLSPFVRPGTVNRTAYNHYALLRCTEDLFSLPHLGFAGQAGLRSCGRDVFNARPARSSPRLAG